MPALGPKRLPVAANGLGLVVLLLTKMKLEMEAKNNFYLHKSDIFSFQKIHKLINYFTKI